MAETEASPPLLTRLIAGALKRKPVRALLLYVEHRGPMLADSVTYRTLFSVFAGVALGFSLAAIWLAGNEQALDALVESVDAVVPGLVGEDALINPALIKAPTGFTVAGVISLIGLVGAAIGAIGSLRTAIRLLADNVYGDILPVFVILRNLVLAIVIGAALVAAAAATFLATSGVGIVSGWFGISAEDPLTRTLTRVASIVVVFILDTGVVAVLYVTLSGVKASARSLWTGAVIGGVGLIALQELSGLFVGGASNNPLLVTFASLIALLLWLNLSAQVILIACAYIITGVDEEKDRVRARFGASTFAQRRMKQAERAVQVASDELAAAREVEQQEREKADA
ncbi:YihY/virulence factor BrkB family protein [Microbacterium sp. P02]|uniref:YihY/virulence factor BrkB family protein n=1 Tax=Microbacterium sp. P02 TaxID=3366260 RepID=UPI00366DBC9C